MAAHLPVILILGPTAGGKTTLAIALARCLRAGGECLCADSMQVYRGMDIGTAKPTPAEQAQIPHHLFDMADPRDDGFTVDHWLSLAENAVAEVRARGRHPIIVGGTNLYVKAFLEGLFEGPSADDRLREALHAQPTETLRDELSRIDPVAAERIHFNDRRRTIRAIEVHRLTGIPLSIQQTQWNTGRIRDDALIIGLDYPVEVINSRINARVRAMMEQGLLEETRRLHEQGLARQAREALGYKQLLAHLASECSLEDAVEAIKIATRRYAKQQRTWLKRFRTLPRSRWISVDETGVEPWIEPLAAWIEQTPPPETSRASSGQATT